MDKEFKLLKKGKGFEVYTQTRNKADIFYICREQDVSLEDLGIDLDNLVLFDKSVFTTPLKEIYIRHPFATKEIDLDYIDSSFFVFGKALIESETKYNRAPASIIVKDNEILGYAVSGNDYHEKHECIRKKKGIVSGSYEICPGCHPDVHSESKAIKQIIEKGKEDLMFGSRVYLYNHWWACGPCSEKLLAQDIHKISFSKSWTKEFLKIKEDFLPKKIYVGCSLTQAPGDFKKEVENFKDKLRGKYDVLDFVGLEQGTAQDVYEWDTKCVRDCDLFIAIATYPAVGLGYEIGIRHEMKKPMLVAAKEETKITRIVQGMEYSGYEFVRYNGLEELLEMLEL